MSELLNERLQVLLTAAERKGVEKLAAKEQRSASFVARRAIQDALKKAKP